jgi:WD40 repeat protein
VSNRPNFVEPEEVEPVAPTPGVVRVPAMAQQDVSTVSRAKRVFANAHAYHINSISVNSDDETFISADDLRVNLWNLGVNDQSFNIVDIKPPTMEELTEVITAARFHPTHCNIFMYSSSKGAIKICDMRAAALCDAHAKSFEEPADPANRSVVCTPRHVLTALLSLVVCLVPCVACFHHVPLKVISSVSASPPPLSLPMCLSSPIVFLMAEYRRRYPRLLRLLFPTGY